MYPTCDPQQPKSQFVLSGANPSISSSYIATLLTQKVRDNLVLGSG